MNNDVTVQQIHKGLLDILQEFKRVCEENDLTWWIDSGTLLGAVREGKIIEWDDDIDVMMPREDYNKLLSLSQKFKEPFILQTPVTDFYCDFMIRVINTDISCYSKYDYDIPGHHYLYIDVFPLDAVPDNKDDLELEANFLKFVKTFWTMRFQTHTEYNKYLDMRSNRQMFYFVNDSLTKITKENSNSKYVACVAFYAARKFRYVKFTRDAFSKTITCKLNGFDVNIPIGYEEVLEGWYGKDWRTPKRDNSGHSFLEEKLYDFEHNNGFYNLLTKEEFLKLFNK